MNQDLFKKELLATKIFQDEKDKAIVSINHLRNKYIQFEGMLDFKSLYVKIINYQIKKYGVQLADPKQTLCFYLQYLDSNGDHWSNWRRNR